MENTCACILATWPRAFLSLAWRGSVLRRAVLGLGLGFFLVSLALALASSLVPSTPLLCISNRGGVEDTRLEAKAKDTKNPRPRPRTSLLRTDPLEAKDQGNKSKCSPKKRKKVFKQTFQANSNKKGVEKSFSGDLQNFNNSKNIAVLST